jgi:hypothetical protein
MVDRAVATAALLTSYAHVTSWGQGGGAGPAVVGNGGEELSSTTVSFGRGREEQVGPVHLGEAGGGLSRLLL